MCERGFIVTRFTLSYFVMVFMVQGMWCSLVMEYYATPWSLWRESWILWHSIELSFGFGVPLSLSLPHCVLLFVLLERECGKNNSLKPSILLVLLV